MDKVILKKGLNTKEIIKLINSCENHSYKIAWNDLHVCIMINYKNLNSVSIDKRSGNIYGTNYEQYLEEGDRD